MAGRSPVPTPWECLRADRSRYSRHAWITQRSLWAIAAFRLAQAADAAPPLPRRALRPPLRMLTLLAQIVTNIEIGDRAEIGPGLLIYHSGLVINNGVVIGAHCTLGVGNVIGNRVDMRCPVLGDRVTLGAGAHVLGGITLGDDVTVGAMSLVIDDVASGSTVAGVPARPLRGPAS